MGALGFERTPRYGALAMTTGALDVAALPAEAPRA